MHAPRNAGALRTVQRRPPAPVVATVAVTVLVSVLGATVGLDRVAVLAGVASGVGLGVLLAAAMRRHARPGLGSADRVTLTRAVLVGGVVALAADGQAARWVAGLALVAIVLDHVDGRVARRTGSASPFGAAFDMEVDAFLVLVLSVAAAPVVGGWVLTLGLARYALGAARLAVPWLRAELPPRYWCKVVAALVGLALVVVDARLVPVGAAVGIAVVATLLLVESFGREVLDLVRLRVPRPPAGWAIAGAVAATVVLWVALALPSDPDELGPWTLVRIPLEILVFLTALVLLPGRAARIVATVVGAAIGLVTVLKLLDLGFRAALRRPFDGLVDWGYLRSGFGLLVDTIGRQRAWLVTDAVVVGVVAVVVVCALAARRLAAVVVVHRRPAVAGLTTLTGAWVALAGTGATLVVGAPVAATSSAGAVSGQVGTIRADLRDRQAFAVAQSNDAYGDVPPDDLLTALRGKDVLLVFVESYGRSAVQDSTFAPAIDAVLDQGTRTLAQAGFTARSGFLTSSTITGASWLAHATLQSGLWVDSQNRYDQLVAGQRLTLSDAFHRAGWRTFSDIPSDTQDWPPGTDFYHLDQLYDSRNVGYVGPKFSYAAMPDQYTFAALQRLELGRPGHAPVMGEVDLVSSHYPWAPLPRLVGWDDLADGSVYDGMPAQGDQPAQVLTDDDAIRAAYGQSIRYSLSALVSFLATFRDPDLVTIVLGDHQPSPVVSGDTGRDVPVSVIARDPAVLDRIGPWGWDDGLRPLPDAPVWRMDEFRDRFLAAFGPAA